LTILEPVVDEKHYISDEKARAIIEQALRKGHITQDGNHLKVVESIQDVFTNKDGVAYCCDANYSKGISPNGIGKGRRTHIIEYKEPQIEMIGMLNINGYEHNRRVHSPEGLSPTVTAVGGGNNHVKIFDYSNYRVRRLTPREYARLQGFPDNYKFVVSDSQLYKQFGNAVTVNVAKAIAISIKDFLSKLS